MVEQPTSENLVNIRLSVIRRAPGEDPAAGKLPPILSLVPQRLKIVEGRGRETT